MPTGIAIIPKPDPPLVTTSPEVFLSLASPLTGCAKSQKYLKVCCCTFVSNASSVITGNLSVESILVMKFMVNAESSWPPAFDFKDVFTVTENLDKSGNAALGTINTVLSALDKDALKGTCIPCAVLKLRAALSVAALMLVEKEN